jgi:hypothetical protein
VILLIWYPIIQLTISKVELRKGLIITLFLEPWISFLCYSVIFVQEPAIISRYLVNFSTLIQVYFWTIQPSLLWITQTIYPNSLYNSLELCIGYCGIPTSSHRFTRSSQKTARYPCSWDWILVPPGAGVELSWYLPASPHRLSWYQGAWGIPSGPHLPPALPRAQLFRGWTWGGPILRLGSLG